MHETKPTDVSCKTSATSAQTIAQSSATRINFAQQPTAQTVTYSSSRWFRPFSISIARYHREILVWDLRSSVARTLSSTICRNLFRVMYPRMRFWIIAAENACTVSTRPCSERNRPSTSSESRQQGKTAHLIVDFHTIALGTDAKVQLRKLCER